MLAERVGFVPVIPSAVNNLGQFSIAQTARNAQNLSIRYKTGTGETARSLSGRAARFGEAAPFLRRSTRALPACPSPLDAALLGLVLKFLMRPEGSDRDGARRSTPSVRAASHMASLAISRLVPQLRHRDDASTCLRTWFNRLANSCWGLNSMNSLSSLQHAVCPGGVYHRSPARATSSWPSLYFR
jgi:hypothetical protein